MYGIFNFVDMLTTPNGNVNLDQTDTGQANTPGGINMAWFFLFHYGFFHFVYFIFLATMAKSGPFEWTFYKTYLLLFFGAQVIAFIQHKIADKKKPLNLATKMVAPYLRIVPMHLCILLPAFFNWSNLTVFLTLKVVADLVAYVVISNQASDKSAQPDILPDVDPG